MKNVLVFDIETAPLEVYTWGTRDQNIALSQIKRDWYVLAFAAKRLGEREMIYGDQRAVKPMSDDRKLLGNLWALLDQADIVITQNGTKFDSRKLNARFILHGMTPPSPYRHLDTYQILSRVADFTSDKLEYYTSKLCTKYKKLSHGKFPGMMLWTECLAGNPKAWDEMRRYNIHDVLSTEELYLKIQGWTPKNAPAITDDRGACKACGRRDRLVRGGTEPTLSVTYVRLHCMACGKWQRGEKLAVAR